MIFVYGFSTSITLFSVINVIALLMAELLPIPDAPIIMKSGDDLFSALEILPEYDDMIRTADVPVRLMALSDLYRIYVPNFLKSVPYSITS